MSDLGSVISGASVGADLTGGNLESSGGFTNKSGPWVGMTGSLDSARPAKQSIHMVFLLIL